MSAAVLLFALTFVWQALKPLRGFFAIMAVIYLVTTVVDPWVLRSASWQGILEGAFPLGTLFGERVLIALEALIVVAALFLLGLKQRDAFLTTGNLAAPVGDVSLPGNK